MILVASGATGGHLYPAIAVIDDCNQPALFVVSRRVPAERILTAHRMPFSVIAFSIRKPLRCMVAFFTLMGLMIKQKPRVVLAMGGGICVPTAMIAWLMRVPIISFEQNAIPGRSTQMIQFFSSEIITAFDSVKSKMHRKSIVKCLGNPIRRRYPEMDCFRKEWEKITGKLLVIVGGSQGSVAINTFVNQHRHQLMARGYHVIHITGSNQGGEPAFTKVEWFNEKIYLAVDYILNMRVLYEKATMVLCRSGATTLAELDLMGIPSVLVPYPYAKDNHQVANAEAFCCNHNSQMVAESELNIDHLLGIFELLESKKTSPSPSRGDDVNASICALLKTYLK